jgi:hypothetical protein
MWPPADAPARAKQSSTSPPYFSMFSRHPPERSLRIQVVRGPTMHRRCPVVDRHTNPTLSHQPGQQRIPLPTTVSNIQAPPGCRKHRVRPRGFGSPNIQFLAIAVFDRGANMLTSTIAMCQRRWRGDNASLPYRISDPQGRTGDATKGINHRHTNVGDPSEPDDWPHASCFARV